MRFNGIQPRLPTDFGNFSTPKELSKYTDTLCMSCMALFLNYIQELLESYNVPIHCIPCQYSVVLVIFLSVWKDACTYKIDIIMSNYVYTYYVDIVISNYVWMCDVKPETHQCHETGIKFLLNIFYRNTKVY